METTMMAAWLNTACRGFDEVLLGMLHGLAQGAGWFFTPCFDGISFLGEKGACFFVFAVILMLHKRTRWTGICLFVAICLGALMTNILLKDIIARPRPFESSALFADWWCFVNSPFEDGFSFPSGHTTAAAAAMSAWMLMRQSVKAVVAGATVIVLMGIARCYLMVHYPTDILAGCLVGLIAGVVAFILVRFAYDRWSCSRKRVAASHSHRRVQ